MFKAINGQYPLTFLFGDVHCGMESINKFQRMKPEMAGARGVKGLNYSPCCMHYGKL